MPDSIGHSSVIEQRESFERDAGPKAIARQILTPDVVVRSHAHPRIDVEAFELHRVAAAAFGLVDAALVGVGVDIGAIAESCESTLGKGNLCTAFEGRGLSRFLRALFSLTLFDVAVAVKQRSTRLCRAATTRSIISRLGGKASSKQSSPPAWCRTPSSDST